MSYPAPSLEAMLDYEGNLESGFIQVLKAAGLHNVASSRSEAIEETPQIVIYVKNGPALTDHQHPIVGLNGGALFPYDTFEGTLVTEITTNRTQDATEGNHAINVARVRKNLFLFRLNLIYTKYQQIQIPFFIREDGSEYSFDTDHNLDTTTINWYIRHAIHPLAWPANPFEGIQMPPVIPPQVMYTYLRPDGTSVYFRPDGTSEYIRP